jgi:molybdopterin-guanine dinucleotide biosynthesis protein A
VGEAGQPPIGAILAGGRGRRIGGDKGLVELGGRPLAQWPLRTMRRVLRDVIVVVKPGTALPRVAGAIVWQEPPEPQHPLMGVVAALRAARGRAVLVCAVDLPFVSEGTLRALAEADAGSAPGVVACDGWDGSVQPLLARYEAAALPALEAALNEAAPVRASVEALGLARYAVTDPVELFNINTREDLAAAEAIVGEGGGFPA